MSVLNWKEGKEYYDVICQDSFPFTDSISKKVFTLMKYYEILLLWNIITNVAYIFWPPLHGHKHE